MKKRLDFKNFSIYFDQYLFIAITLLSVMGLFFLYSASQEDITIVAKQAVFVSFGLLLMFAVSQLDPDFYKTYSGVFLVISILLIFATTFFGKEINGAKRWLTFGVFNLQPSELMKITLPLMIAWLYQRYQNKISLRLHFTAIFLICIPVHLVLLQPDLGTSIMIAFSGFLIIFLAGISWRLIISSMIVAILSSPLIWINLHTYQKNRIINMLDPFVDPLGTGYHTIQSMIAIGSGGGFGKGWGEGSQTNLNFLPEANTDFIFAVYSEEFGFFGVTIIFALFLLLIFRIFILANNMQSTFSKLLTVSLGVSIFSAIFVNIAMISGLAPIVGLPLPFMSYGGTSMVVSLASVGIIMSLNNHKTLIAN